MDPADRLLGLLQQLYAAPGTDDGWRAFMETLRTSVHGSTANLVSHSLESHRGVIVATAGADVEGTDLYSQYWSAFDPWAHSAKQVQLGEGAVSVGDGLIEHTQLTRTAFYTDFARHYDLVRIIGGVVEANPVSSSVLSVARSERRNPFGGREVMLFTALVPHIQRALQLHRRLTGAQTAVEDLTAVIERTARAVLLLDAHGRITFTSPAASRLLATRDGLSVDRAELRATNASDRNRLRTAIADAVNTSSGAGFRAGGMLAIGRPSGRRPYVVLVCPVTHRPRHFPGVESAVAIVFVKDPEQIAVPDHATLRTLFGLTPAEAKLTSLLVQGASLVEAGAQLGLRRETARSRLKTIFEKTHTHRQAELVLRVLHTTPPI